MLLTVPVRFACLARLFVTVELCLGLALLATTFFVAALLTAAHVAGGVLSVTCSPVGIFVLEGSAFEALVAVPLFDFVLTVTDLIVDVVTAADPAVDVVGSTVDVTTAVDVTVDMATSAGLNVDEVTAVGLTVDLATAVGPTVDLAPAVGPTVDEVTAVSLTVEVVPAVGQTVDVVAAVGQTVDMVPVAGLPVDEVTAVGLTVDVVTMAGRTIDIAPAVAPTVDVVTAVDVATAADPTVDVVITVGVFLAAGLISDNPLTGSCAAAKMLTSACFSEEPTSCTDLAGGPTNTWFTGAVTASAGSFGGELRVSRLQTAHGNPVTEMSSISFLTTQNLPFPAASGGSAILAGCEMLLAEFPNGVLLAGRFTLACKQACGFVNRFSAVPPFTALCLW